MVKLPIVFLQPCQRKREGEHMNPREGLGHSANSKPWFNCSLSHYLETFDSLSAAARKLVIFFQASFREGRIGAIQNWQVFSPTTCHYRTWCHVGILQYIGNVRKVQMSAETPYSCLGIGTEHSHKNENVWFLVLSNFSQALLVSSFLMLEKWAKVSQ